jgi:hypothetical protein
MIDTLSTRDPLQYAWNLVYFLGGRYDRDMLSDDFVGGVSENPFCPAIPAEDNSVEVFADYRVIRRFDDGGETLLKIVGALCSVISIVTPRA